MTKMYTVKFNGMEFTAPTQAEALALMKEALAIIGKPSTSGRGSKNSTTEPKVKDTPFTKHDGTVVMTTKAQAEAWEARRANFANKEANLKAWEEKKASYKPTQKFIDAIRKDRAAITFKIAKEQYGFVGTKDSLKALKDEVCAK